MSDATRYERVGQDYLGWDYEVTAEKLEDGDWVITSKRVKHDSPTIGSTQEILLSGARLNTEFAAGRAFADEIALWRGMLEREKSARAYKSERAAILAERRALESP